jgi:hypothetical protein
VKRCDKRAFAPGRILKSQATSLLNTKLELWIDIRTAKAVGLNVPDTLIGRADKAIKS